MQESNFIIRRGLTDNASRELIITPNFLKFENKDRVNNSFTTFENNQIEEYRFGVKWMRYYFTFGREYIIEIKNSNKEILKINFKTYFGRKKNEYHNLCNQILSALWDNYFEELAKSYIQKHERGEEFNIGEVSFLTEGIIIETNSSIKLKKALIPWEKVRTKTYVTYFAIYAVDKAADTNRGYSYLNDWNTVVLRNVIVSLLKSKNVEE